MVFPNKSMFNSSSLALVKASGKSLPFPKGSIWILVNCWEDKVLLTFSTSLFNLPVALRLVETSAPIFL